MADIPGQIEPLVDERRLTNPIWYEWLLGFYRSFSAFKSNAEGAWTAFTPTVTAGSSGPPTVTTAARYKQIGKTISVHYDITVTALNGSAGVMIATLPVAPALNATTMAGVEATSTGNSARGIIAAGASVVQIAMYNNSTPFGVGFRLIMDGIYEV